MELNVSILEEIGLTKSEIKVYLALLKTGTASKKHIVKESGITPSKMYEVTDKLIQKGMVSFTKQNKVLHFTASPPEQVLNFLEQKKESLDRQSEEFKLLIPKLASLQKTHEPVIEVFRGREGLKTAYDMLLSSLDKNIVVIIAKVGAKKKLDIIKKAHDLKLKMLNIQEDKAK